MFNNIDFNNWHEDYDREDWQARARRLRERRWRALVRKEREMQHYKKERPKAHRSTVHQSDQMIVRY